MKGYLNPQTFAGEARMRRALFKGAFLYVEGQSDEKLYGMFVDESQCQIIIAHTRSHVLEACRILEAEGFVGFVGIVDADFDHLEGKTIDVKAVFRTDSHDGECLMLSTAAFDRVLLQFVSGEKLKKWRATHGSDVRHYLLQQAAIIGCLLWHSTRSAISLTFEGLEAKEYTNSMTVEIDLQRLVRHVKNKSGRHDLTDAGLIEGVRQGLKASTDLWQVVRGHDFIDLLAFALRKALGSWQALEVTRERLELCLRLAYSADDFSHTRLFSDVRGWEGTHAPFRIFRETGQKPMAC